MAEPPEETPEGIVERPQPGAADFSQPHAGIGRGDISSLRILVAAVGIALIAAGAAIAFAIRHGNDMHGRVTTVVRSVTAPPGPVGPRKTPAAGPSTPRRSSKNAASTKHCGTSIVAGTKQLTCSTTTRLLTAYAAGQGKPTKDGALLFTFPGKTPKGRKITLRYKCKLGSALPGHGPSLRCHTLHRR